MQSVDKETYDALVNESTKPTIVDLWGPQCAPCLALMPEVEALAASYGDKVDFFKLNVAENRRVAITLKVMGVPTFLFYKNGEQVSRISGDEVNMESIKKHADALLA